jgi:energy-coupling factor transport system permease protein
LPEWIVAAGGVACAVLLFRTASDDPSGLDPSLTPLTWPTLPSVAVLAVLLAGVAALAAPPPVRRRLAVTRAAANRRERVAA